MSADYDGDHQMISSPEESDTELQTPAAQITSSQILSSPDSQPRNMPTSNAGASIANSNGKRPLNTISNGQDDREELQAITNGKSRQEHPTKTHAGSGYSWNRLDAEPGHAWMNKKAQDEARRAWDSLVHKEFMIAGRYGDPFELARNEQVLINSTKQK